MGRSYSKLNDTMFARTQSSASTVGIGTAPAAGEGRLAVGLARDSDELVLATGGSTPAMRHASSASTIAVPQRSHSTCEVRMPHSGHNADVGGSSAEAVVPVPTGAGVAGATSAGERMATNRCPNSCKNAKCSWIRWLPA